MQITPLVCLPFFNCIGFRKFSKQLRRVTKCWQNTTLQQKLQCTQRILVYQSEEPMEYTAQHIRNSNKYDLHTEYKEMDVDDGALP